MTHTVTQFPRPTSRLHKPEVVHCDTSKECGIETTETSRTFHFWRGASSRRYVHIVHGIFECPDIKASNYVLARVDAGGVRTPVRISRTTSAHGSENLAEIRFHAARLGATEVHLHVLADTPHAQSITQWDLEAAHFGSLLEDGASDTRQFTVNA